VCTHLLHIAGVHEGQCRKPYSNRFRGIVDIRLGITVQDGHGR
jgi:hypothetical protein